MSEEKTLMIARVADPTGSDGAMRLPPKRRDRRLLTGWRAFCAAAVLTLTATLAGAPPAGAEVLNPRQDWMRNATAGVFLHWGMFTAPIHLDCAQWEHDVTAGGWTPGYWIDEAR